MPSSIEEMRRHLPIIAIRKEYTTEIEYIDEEKWDLISEEIENDESYTEYFRCPRIND